MLSLFTNPRSHRTVPPEDRSFWPTHRLFRVPARNNAAPDRKCNGTVARADGDRGRSPHEAGSTSVPTRAIAPMTAHVRAGQVMPGLARSAATVAITGIGHGAATPDPRPSTRWTGTRPGKRRPSGSSGRCGSRSETAVENAVVAAKIAAAPSIFPSLMGRLSRRRCEASCLVALPGTYLVLISKFALSANRTLVPPANVTMMTM